jgi:hypothetical protein
MSRLSRSPWFYYPNENGKSTNDEAPDYAGSILKIMCVSNIQ